MCLFLPFIFKFSTKKACTLTQMKCLRAQAGNSHSAREFQICLNCSLLRDWLSLPTRANILFRALYIRYNYEKLEQNYTLKMKQNWASTVGPPRNVIELQSPSLSPLVYVYFKLKFLFMKSSFQNSRKKLYGITYTKNVQFYVCVLTFYIFCLCQKMEVWLRR